MYCLYKNMISCTGKIFIILSQQVLIQTSAFQIYLDQSLALILIQLLCIHTKQSYDFNSSAVLSLWPVTSPLNSRIMFYCKREQSAVKKVVLVLSVQVPTHSMLAHQRREWREGTEEARFRSRVENILEFKKSKLS